MKKKFLAVMLTLMIGASLCACDNKETSGEEAAPVEEASEEGTEEAMDEETQEEEVAEEGAPVLEDDRLIAEDPVDLMDIEGSYFSDEGGQISILAYEDGDDAVLGWFTMYGTDGVLAFEGDFQELMTNYYGLTQADVNFTVFYEEDTYWLDVYADGEPVAYFEQYMNYNEEYGEEGAPVVDPDRACDEEPIDMLEIAGSYAGGPYPEIDINMYTSTDDAAVGTIDMYDENGDLVYSGEIIEFMTNYYGMMDADVNFTVYTTDGNLCLDVYIDGQHVDNAVMTEHYES